jgi:hypothetical protein
MTLRLIERIVIGSSDAYEHRRPAAAETGETRAFLEKCVRK